MSLCAAIAGSRSAPHDREPISARLQRPRRWSVLPLIRSRLSDRAEAIVSAQARIVKRNTTLPIWSDREGHSAPELGEASGCPKTGASTQSPAGADTAETLATLRDTSTGDPLAWQGPSRLEQDTAAGYERLLVLLTHSHRSGGSGLRSSLGRERRRQNPISGGLSRTALRARARHRAACHATRQSPPLRHRPGLVSSQHRADGVPQVAKEPPLHGSAGGQDGYDTHDHLETDR